MLTLFSIGTALLLLTIVFSFYRARQLEESVQWIEDTRDLLTQLMEFRGKVAEADRSERDYLITGDARLLTSFDAATNRLWSLASSLRSRSFQSQDQQKRLWRLHQVLTDQQSLWTQTMRARSNNSAATPAQLLPAEAEQRNNAELEDTLERLVGDSESLLSHHEIQRVQSERTIIWIDNAARLLSLLLIGWAFRAFWLENLRRRASEVLLSRAGEALEQRVADRTVALRRSSERTERMIRISPDLIFIHRGGTIEFINDTGVRLLGATSAADFIGRNLYDLIHPEYHDQVKERIGRLEAGDGTVEIIEERILRADQGWLEVEATAVRFHDEQGVAIQVVMRDITERKRHERRLARINLELEDKNRDLETLVHVVSHDLRSPLVNVQGFTARLGRACSRLHKEWDTIPLEGAEKSLEAQRLLAESIPESLGFIEGGVSKMEALLSGFLRFSRAGRVSLSPIPLNMNELVEDVVRSLKIRLDSVQADLRIEPLPGCVADPIHTGQVFTNLLDNAVKYSEPTRSLSILISGRVEEGRAIFSIRDNGIGIATEHQPRIFEIFHRLDPQATDGDGLGLAMTQRLLERQQGRIWVESQLGVGTTLFVSLPSVSVENRTV